MRCWCVTIHRFTCRTSVLFEFMLHTNQGHHDDAVVDTPLPQTPLEYPMSSVVRRALRLAWSDTKVRAVLMQTFRMSNCTSCAARLCSWQWLRGMPLL